MKAGSNTSVSAGDLCQIRHEVLGIERHRNRGQHLAAGLLDIVLGFLIGALAPGVVGIDHAPFLAEILDAPRQARRRDRIGVGAGAERITRSLGAGRFGRLAGGEVDRLEFGRDRDRRQHHAGMHRTDDEFGIGALDQVTQLAGAARRIRFGIFGDEFDLAAGDAAALVDDFDRGLGRLVVPVAPGRDHACEVAVMADDDRARGLGECVPHDREVSGSGGAACKCDIRESCGGIVFLPLLDSPL